MEKFDTFNSLASLSLLFFWAGFFFLFFRLSPRFLHLLRLPRRYELFLLKWLPFVELLVWLGVAIFAASWFATSSLLLFVVFGLVAVIIVLYVSWYYLRDLIAGVMIRREGFVKTGENVVIGDARGKVVAMGLQGMQLETGREEVIYIPYQQVSTLSIRKTSIQRHRQAHTFSIEYPGEISVIRARKKTLKAILLAPNVVSGEAVDIIIGEQSTLGRRIEISAVLYDLERASETENYIRGELLR